MGAFVINEASYPIPALYHVYARKFTNDCFPGYQPPGDVRRSIIFPAWITKIPNSVYNCVLA